jgi:hypothetical protein
MIMGYRKSRYKTTYVIAFWLLISIAGLIIISQRNESFTVKRQGPIRPATIDNVVLRIESNLMRTQSAMEKLVFIDYASGLAKEVKTINHLEAAIYKDFKEMGGHFPKSNTQYLNALALFRGWKTLRDKAIILTTAGPSLQAKQLVRDKSADHLQKIRDALMVLNKFSQKRAYDFDSAASRRN